MYLFSRTLSAPVPPASSAPRCAVAWPAWCALRGAVWVCGGQNYNTDDVLSENCNRLSSSYWYGEDGVGQRAFAASSVMDDGYWWVSGKTGSERYL